MSRNAKRSSNAKRRMIFRKAAALIAFAPPLGTRITSASTPRFACTRSNLRRRSSGLSDRQSHPCLFQRRGRGLKMRRCVFFLLSIIWRLSWSRIICHLKRAVFRLKRCKIITSGFCGAFSLWTRSRCISKKKFVSRTPPRKTQPSTSTCMKRVIRDAMQVHWDARQHGHIQGRGH